MQKAEIETKLSHLHHLKAAKEALERAEADLALLHKFKTWKDESQPWRVNLLLQKGEYYGRREITVSVEVPFSVVQQQLVDKVKQAKRRVVQLEGEQP